MKLFKSMLPVAFLNLAALLLASYWQPSQVPIHFNYAGIADSWAPKWAAVLLGLIPVVLAAGMLFYRHRTKDNERYKKNRKQENILLPLILFLFIPFTWLPFSEPVWRDNRYMIPGLICLFLGITFTVFANYTGTLKPNRYFGLRVPWTLKSDTVWTKTHRMAAYWGILGGLLFIAGGVLTLLLRQIGFAIGGFVAALVCMPLIPTIYSAVIYRKEKNK